MKATDIDGRRLCRHINLAAGRLDELGDDLLNAGWDDVAERLYRLADDARELVGGIHANHGERND